ncbi:YbfB/YjiJ family MFS transporter [Phyllobacterium myrsinacearum]|uniref:Putative MFS family arabinose efflux permease n=1 Tax=Phyllobacterium myrsinacearum TaxID=28101 RepID=A0A839EHC9_9HYPH|nr:YbfB/YjiJ family MFS transporter [Phyllobacterium myrsinacearum]MBA8876964.1 putative MFS family arabinose efflux permease [Phyllobacterium myrsinacearum]
MTSSANSPVRFALGGLVTMAVAMGIGRFIFTPILPAMMTDLGLTPGDAGIIASANYVGYLIGAIIAGYGWASGIERPVVIVSLAASAALCLAMSLSDSILVFSILRFLAGVASAFMLVLAATIVFSHLAVAKRHDLQAMHFGGVGAGIALSSVLVAASAASGFGWRQDWIGAAVLSVLGLLAVVWLLREGPVRTGADTKEPPVRWTPDFLKINIAYGVFGFGYIITATFIIAIVRSSNGGASMEALVWFVTGVAAAFSVWLWAPLLRRVGPFAVVALGMLVQAAGVAASVLLPPPVGPILGGILLGLTFIVITASGFQAGRALLPQSPRRVMAVMTAAFGIGQIIGPLVGGYLANITGNFTAATLAAAASLVIGAGFAFLSRR